MGCRRSPDHLARIVILAGEEIGAVARSRHAGVPGGVEGATARMPAAAASCVRAERVSFVFCEMRSKNQPFKIRAGMFLGGLSP